MKPLCINRDYIHKQIIRGQLRLNDTLNSVRDAFETGFEDYTRDKFAVVMPDDEEHYNNGLFELFTEFAHKAKSLLVFKEHYNFLKED